MATVTAQNILDENNYTDVDITLTKIEALIDNAINYTNLKTGLTISNMEGSSGSKTVTVTNRQAPVIKAIASLYVRACVDHGPNASVDGLTVSTVSSDPQIDLLKEIGQHGIIYLRALNRKGME